MKTLCFFLAFAFSFALLPTAHAQSDGGWWDWAARNDRDGRYDDRYDRRDRGDDWEDRDDRYDDRDDDWYEGRRDRRGQRRSGRDRARGPKFCQNGQDHPTKGMRWCREKGFEPRGSVRRAARRAERWERRRVEDIIFRVPRRDRHRAVVERALLADILGPRRYRQLERVAVGPLAARWVFPSRRVRVLQVRDRRGPIAELTDLNGDGRVDVFLTNRLR
jgi:hypothetical protein